MIRSVFREGKDWGLVSCISVIIVVNSNCTCCLTITPISLYLYIHFRLLIIGYISFKFIVPTYKYRLY